jgi:peptidoglycan/LPS O-acetylase OafA/YrhL
VLFYHQTWLYDVVETRFDLWFSHAVSVGWCGVDLFFVLSGFLITGILLDTKQHPRYFRNFYARRTLRIFPLYYAVVFLSLAVIPNLPEGVVPARKLEGFGRIEGDELWYWLYLSNFAIARAEAWRHGILDVSWSLAIEEQFYLVWPTVVWICSRRALTRVCIGLVIAAPCIRLAMTLAGFHPIAVYVLTPGRLDPLAIGALIALAARSPGGLQVFVPQCRRILAWCGAMLFAAFLLAGELSPEDPRVQVVGFSVLAVFFGALLVLVLQAGQGDRLGRIFSSASLRMFGKYSYALYLFHLPLRAVIRDVLFAPDRYSTAFGTALRGQLIQYVLSTLLTVAVAMLSWRFYEAPFLKLKRYFETR